MRSALSVLVVATSSALAKIGIEYHDEEARKDRQFTPHLRRSI